MDDFQADVVEGLTALYSLAAETDASRARDAAFMAVFDLRKSVSLLRLASVAITDTEPRPTEEVRSNMMDAISRHAIRLDEALTGFLASVTQYP